MERELILRAKTGSRQAFGCLIKNYLPRLYKAAYSFMRNVDDASDICQDAFLNAYRNISRFDEERSFYPWIYKILKNLCINHTRKASRTAFRLDSIDTLESDILKPEEEVLRNEEIFILRKAWGRLPDRHREILCSPVNLSQL